MCDRVCDTENFHLTDRVNQQEINGLRCLIHSASQFAKSKLELPSVCLQQQVSRQGWVEVQEGCWMHVEMVAANQKCSGVMIIVMVPILFATVVQLSPCSADT